MFGIPGSLLEYAQPGSSLTYQNLEGEYTKFVRTCLAPNYLEPIEQAMSDLLTRSTIARFAVAGLLRADSKTRAEVDNILIPLGVKTVAEARAEEGYEAGDVEYAPMPKSEPSAVPASLPTDQTGLVFMEQRSAVRCTGRITVRGILRTCNKWLAGAEPFVGTCPRCKTEYAPVILRA